MKFKGALFSSAKFEPRTESVAVSDLAEWFECEEGEKPAWVVRGLTGVEIAKTSEANNQSAQATRIVAALARNSEKEKTKEILEMMGLDDETPADIAKRIEQLVVASVEPKCDRHLAVKLFEHYPVVAYMLSNKILELTGLGAVLGKPKASTPKTKSK